MVSLGAVIATCPETSCQMTGGYRPNSDLRIYYKISPNADICGFESETVKVCLNIF